jgi:iron complex transport system substrate-binding protein
MNLRWKFLCGWLLLTLGLRAGAEIVVRDDAGETVRLPAPATRIVALAPHVVENLYAVGAGDRIVGAVDYSDYPEPANALPRVGGYSQIDLERVVALKPDVVIAWQSGNEQSHVAKLKAMGLRVYQSQPGRFEDIAGELTRFAQLAGTEAKAKPVVDGFLARLAELRRKYGQKPKVRVFYQVWQEPLRTVGGAQIISSAIAACGGENVFAGMKQMSPQISHESVIALDPEAFVAGGMGEERRDWLEAWRRWTQLSAVKRDNLFFIKAELMQRHTLRLLDGAEQLCAHLETARARRPTLK